MLDRRFTQQFTRPSASYAQGAMLAAPPARVRDGGSYTSHLAPVALPPKRIDPEPVDPEPAEPERTEIRPVEAEPVDSMPVQLEPGANAVFDSAAAAAPAVAPAPSGSAVGVLVREEEATEAAVATEPQPAAEPALEPADASTADDASSLSGYGAYERITGPGLNLSRDELVQRYAHLVKYVVGRLGVSIPGLFDHEDAMQAGVLGLLRAIDAYKPEAAASFESYAILRIRGAILDAVRSLDSVGRAGREAARAIQGAIRELQHELGRMPTEGEIAARLNLTVARYRERLQSASIVTISLDEHDARDGDDEQGVLADNAADPAAVDPADEAARRDAIAGLVREIGRLGTRAKTVLGLYYQDEMTFKEIGQVLGVTESRVCQIHTEAILTLRGRLVDPDIAARLGRRRARA